VTLNHLPLQTTLPRVQGSLPSTPLQLAVISRSSSGVSVDLLRATLFHPLTSVLPVIEECGAMPDLEDREGEVRQTSFTYPSSLMLHRPLCTRQLFMATYRSLNICCQKRQMFTLATQMDGQHSTMLAPRSVLVPFSTLFYPSW